MDYQELAKVVKEPASAELTTNGMQQPNERTDFCAFNIFDIEGQVLPFVTHCFLYV
jgi:hypothetical protein